MKVLALLGTLKKSPDPSNTEELLNEVLARLKAHGAETKTIRLVDCRIKHGLTTEMDDDWGEIVKELYEADIVIFATPIWWGQPSSLIQKVFERMNQIDDEYMTTGKSKLYHKAAGVIITGHEDGVQHVVGTIANSLIWYGFVLPPECVAYWVGEAGPPMDKDAEKRRANMASKTMVGVMAHNLYHYAKIISDNKDFLDKEHNTFNAKSVVCAACEKSGIKNISLPEGWRKRPH